LKALKTFATKAKAKNSVKKLIKYQLGMIPQLTNKHAFILQRNKTADFLYNSKL